MKIEFSTTYERVYGYINENFNHLWIQQIYKYDKININQIFNHLRDQENTALLNLQFQSPSVGLEPTTTWLKATRSTTELRRHYCLIVLLFFRKNYLE